MIGATVSHYRIVEKLGAGGMGDVYLAEDTELGRKVALKFLPPHISGDEVALERFQREARVTAALQHPNVVTIHEIASHEGRRFIVMEYIEGEPLRRRIAAGRLPVSEAVRIAISLCEALGETHEAGIIHRDLKPDNIIIDKRGQPHVLDFGLAVHGDATRLTQEGSTVGTFHYMSPEQSRGDRVDPRTDVFSLGAILYEMITGEKAFPGENAAVILNRIANEDPPPLSHHTGDVSPELERVVFTALAKDRQARYAAMPDLRADLGRLQTGSSTVGSTTGPRLPVVGPRLTAALVALIVIAAAAAIYTLMPGESSDETASPLAVSQVRTLAVLPLHNASDDPEEEYFADGMTDALIADLSRVSALSVVPRSTVMRHKDSRRPSSEIGTELGADAVIEGSVWHGGNRVRITVDLVLAGSGDRLWGESYEDEMNDLLELQSRVAREITGQVRANLSPFEEQWFSQKRSVVPEAHKAYLKGRYYANLVSFPGLEKAVEQFQRAVALDPGFAPAYYGMADALYALQQVEKAREYANKALELDPTLADAHTLLASIKIHNEWDWAGGRKELERATQLQPDTPAVRATTGDLLMLGGRMEEGIASYQSALALNPFSHHISCVLVGRYVDARRYDKAVEFGVGVVSDFPHCPFEHHQVGRAYLLLGRYQDAIRHLEVSLETHEMESTRGLLGCAYALSGRTDAAQTILAELLRTQADPYSIARLQAVLGNHEDALAWLETALSRRDPALIWIRTDALFDALHDEPRFAKLVDAVGLPSS